MVKYFLWEHTRNTICVSCMFLKEKSWKKQEKYLLEKLFVFSPEKSFGNHMTCFPMGFSEGNTTWRQQCTLAVVGFHGPALAVVGRHRSAWCHGPVLACIGCRRAGLHWLWPLLAIVGQRWLCWPVLAVEGMACIGCGLRGLSWAGMN